MLNYLDFYDIATHLNEINRNIFSTREIAENAYDYIIEYESSKKNKKPTHTMIELYKLLLEDYESDKENSDLEYWIDELKEII